ncbi:PREDICTED: uncharacterized protein LOC104730993 [Camelina sativa]|uniref:Uncharacterized protein LOC104730993 n=1 Tax=Camelina sativa TaxID=90675 RepID=A0ABM0UZE9_CAMSA|nr:PREDICTED: uncharacterized protein LOC104730993 [Camelina sativa]
MGDNTLVGFFYKHGKTCVFWDVNDYPIPDGLDPSSIYQSIKDAIKKHGCDAEVTIHAYADDNTVSDDLRRQLLDAGFKFEVFSPGGDHARHCTMYCDMVLWAFKHPTPPLNLIVLAKVFDCEGDFYTFMCALRISYHAVLFSEKKQIWPGAPLFTSIFDGGRNNISGSSLNVSGS